MEGLLITRLSMYTIIIDSLMKRKSQERTCRHVYKDLQYMYTICQDIMHIMVVHSQKIVDCATLGRVESLVQVCTT